METKKKEKKNKGGRIDVRFAGSCTSPLCPTPAGRCGRTNQGIAYRLLRCSFLVPSNPRLLLEVAFSAPPNLLVPLLLSPPPPLALSQPPPLPAVAMLALLAADHASA